MKLIRTLILSLPIVIKIIILDIIYKGFSLWETPYIYITGIFSFLSRSSSAFSDR